MLNLALMAGMCACLTPTSLYTRPQENQFDDQMLNLALMAGPREQLDAARYFEALGKGGVERSVMLYHKAGLLTKATDLAFRSVTTLLFTQAFHFHSFA